MGEGLSLCVISLWHLTDLCVMTAQRTVTIQACHIVGLVTDYQIASNGFEGRTEHMLRRPERCRGEQWVGSQPRAGLTSTSRSLRVLLHSLTRECHYSTRAQCRGFDAFFSTVRDGMSEEMGEYLSHFFLALLTPA